MKKLIELLDSDNIKQKRTRQLAELLYNNNGRIVTSNLFHIEASYKLKNDYGIKLSIKRLDYSSDHIIDLDTII